MLEFETLNNLYRQAPDLLSIFWTLYETTELVKEENLDRKLAVVFLSNNDFENLDKLDAVKSGLIDFNIIKINCYDVLHGRKTAMFHIDPIYNELLNVDAPQISNVVKTILDRLVNKFGHCADLVIELIQQSVKANNKNVFLLLAEYDCTYFSANYSMHWPVYLCLEHKKIDFLLSLANLNHYHPKMMISYIEGEYSCSGRFNTEFLEVCKEGLRKHEEYFNSDKYMSLVFEGRLFTK